MTREPLRLLQAVVRALCWSLVLVVTLALAIGSLGEPAEAAAITEYLRLEVPAGMEQAWLAAERATWEPWLRAQPGFLGRELFWDSSHQEGLLLIHWASRDQWQAIPEARIAQVQRQFETQARRALHQTSLRTPFPLRHSGEFQPMQTLMPRDLSP